MKWPLRKAEDLIIKSRRKTPAFRHGDISRVLYLALDTSVWYNNCMDYKSNCNVVYSCKYHVVWCPKYRRKVLVNGVDERLKSLNSRDLR